MDFEVATLYLDTSFVSTRGVISSRLSLNEKFEPYNVMLQKKASLPEFIKGSYMVVLTFEFAC